MYKLFTQDQATELISVVEPLLRELQETFKEAVRLRDERAALRPDSLRAQQLSAELAFVVRSAQLTKLELDRLGVVVKDVEQGLVNFPSTVAGEVVYLCWEQGEAAVTHYHALNEAVDARHPLPQRRGDARASA
jgi:hypothetical protein